MAGEARTSEFLLTTATVMIGPQSKVMELNPSQHSVGLIKNVQATANMNFTELTQGINAQIVSSVNTTNQAKITGEVYEYTARNLAYAAGIDSSGTDYDPITDTFPLKTAITTGGASIALNTGDGAKWSAGDYGVIADTDNPDRLHVFKVQSIATDTLTLATAYAMPTTMTFGTATTIIYRVHSIKVGAVARQPTFGCKLVGLLPESGQPITMIFPKVKITKGLSVNFQTNDFANMPFEFTPYSLVAADPFFADFGTTKTYQILRT